MLRQPRLGKALCDVSRAPHAVAAARTLRRLEKRFRLTSRNLGIPRHAKAGRSTSSQAGRLSTVKPGSASRAAASCGSHAAACWTSSRRADRSAVAAERWLSSCGGAAAGAPCSRCQPVIGQLTVSCCKPRGKPAAAPAAMLATFVLSTSAAACV